MSYNNSPNDHQDVYQYAYATQSNYGHHYLADTNSMGPGDESSFWSSSPRSDSPSPNGPVQSPVVGPYQIYSPIPYGGGGDHRHTPYRTGYPLTSISTENDGTGHISTPYVRVVKRRTTANKKERRRTQSINNAYADLRDCIPNVPADTKLSKIKTLRLATSYISYLTGVLETDDPAGGFRAELGTISRKSSSNGPTQINDCSTGRITPKSDISEDVSNARRAKGRTGWPQHVWALELKQEQSL